MGGGRLAAELGLSWGVAGRVPPLFPSDTSDCGCLWVEKESEGVPLRREEHSLQRFAEVVKPMEEYLRPLFPLLSCPPEARYPPIKG